MIRVLFADDHPRLRASWERLLQAQPDMECAGVIARADDLAAAVASLNVSVVLIDLSMPGKDPLAALTELSAASGDVRVVVYTGHSDPSLFRAAFDAGAWGYVDKLTPLGEVLDIVRRVAGGELVYPKGWAPT
jgi:DNA-binding NarL/FixJ family response regulator